MTKPQSNAVATVIREERKHNARLMAASHGGGGSSSSKGDHHHHQDRERRLSTAHLEERGFSLEGAHIDSHEIRLLLGEDPMRREEEDEGGVGAKGVSFKKEAGDRDAGAGGKKKGRRSRRSKKSGEEEEDAFASFDPRSGNVMGFADILHMETKKELRVRRKKICMRVYEVRCGLEREEVSAQYLFPPPPAPFFATRKKRSPSFFDSGYRELGGE